MIDCNNVKNFFPELKRMCKSTRCEDCGISIRNNSKSINCGKYYEISPKDAAAVVQSWSDAHPLKTFLSDFLEKYPKAPLSSDGSLQACPHTIGYCEYDGCYGSCKNCWDRPLTEENKC